MKYKYTTQHCQASCSRTIVQLWTDLVAAQITLHYIRVTSYEHDHWNSAQKPYTSTYQCCL